MSQQVEAIPADSAVLVRRYLEAFNRGDLAALDAIVAPDYVEHAWHAVPELPPNALVGLEAHKRSLAMQRNAFPDLQVRIDCTVAEQDRVVVLWTAHGSHGGPYLGVPPSGARMIFRGVTAYRVERGQLAEEWSLSDRVSTWQQLGLLPAIGEILPTPVPGDQSV